MAVQVRHADMYVLNMRARMPFRYGIATLTALPHLFVRVELDVDGSREVGIASDGLAPKWFTKDPSTSVRDDIDDMLTVIRTACRLVEETGPRPSVFDLWQAVYAAQGRWATERGYPPLLWGFGVSLVERAVIDAFCRLQGISFAAALRANLLGVRLGELHQELVGLAPAQLLPDAPPRSTLARHTVGLADPLTDGDIAGSERVDDGLPQSLEASIRAYGLTRFKVKLWGEPDRDLPRLRSVAAVLAAYAPDYAFTLDGNEQYHDVGAFRAFWETLRGDGPLAPFMERLLFVEQPLHRDVALSAAVEREQARWRDRPPMIIDESDGLIESLPRALKCGYAGTSHKNCKGVFKGVANACLLERLRRLDPAGAYILSGEDLASVGPVAMVQDLMVAANLGITHVERNGHHYFTGLSMYPPDVQTAVLAAHADLYCRHERGYAALRIEHGVLRLGSIVDAPFGLLPRLDVTRFVPVEQWRFATLA